MSITRAQVTSLEALATWLDANTSIFKTVDFSSNTLIATDADDNTILEILDGSGGYIKAYRAAGNSISTALNHFPDTTKNTIDIIACDNGVILSLFVASSEGSQRPYAVMFAKTNNGKIATIFSTQATNTASDSTTKLLNHVAFGDSTTMSTTTTFTPESGQQTNFCTFCTNADITDISYTPKAFYLPMHSAYNSGIGMFLLGGKVYITNGYWAIDTEQTEEDAT